MTEAGSKAVFKGEKKKRERNAPADLSAGVKEFLSGKS